MKVCLGHSCDRCSLCTAGICCGADVITLNLPEEGSWPENIQLPLGELSSTSDGLVICHICNWEGHALGHHIKVHNISADQYRAYFGLCSSQGLVSNTLHQKFVSAGKKSSTKNEALLEWNNKVTSEQRSIIVTNREQRLQRRKFFSSDKQYLRGMKNKFLLDNNPVLREQLSIKVRLAKRKEDPGIVCPECGCLFCSWISRRSKTNQSKTCSQRECILSAKSRAAQKRWR